MTLFHQKTAALVASGTALVLVILKVAVGLATGTLSLLASAADSAFDLLISVFNFFVLKKSGQPSDEHYNYGRGKLEAIASIIEGCVIFVSALLILVAGLMRLLRRSEMSELPAATITMLISLVITFALVQYLSIVVKKTRNTVIQADVIHYKADLLSNLGIMGSLVVIQFTGWFLIDALVSMAVSAYLIYATIPLMRSGFYMLMDRALDADVVAKIRQLFEDEDRLSSYHALRTRQSADVYFVDVHLVFDKHISLMDAHTVADRLAAEIRRIEQRTWVCNMHMDPTDDSKVSKLHPI